jgi:hypothetical protein
MAVIEAVEERFERRLMEEIGKLRTEIAEEIGKLRVEVAGEISKLRVELSEEMSKLRAEMACLRTDLIRWMFLFAVGHVVVMTCILFAFFRK